jgi:hypothetical protein
MPAAPEAAPAPEARALPPVPAPPAPIPPVAAPEAAAPYQNLPQLPAEQVYVPPPPPAPAIATGPLAELYGQGVHAYNRCDFFTSYDLFSRAIGSGSLDPRVFYFRGLAAAGQGRVDEAEADFQEAARLEARGNFGNEIGRALARIQGSCRVQLEEIRLKARQDYASERAAEAMYRQQTAGVQEQDLLREPPTPRQPPVIPNTRQFQVDEAEMIDPNAPAGQPRVEAPDALGGVQPADPFSGQPAAPAGEPAAPAPPAADDPFGAPAAPAGDDPFAAPPAAGGADPFGT